MKAPPAHTFCAGFLRRPDAGYPWPQYDAEEADADRYRG
jgi:hypothetical protein